MMKGKEKGRSNALPATDTLYNMCPSNKMYVAIALRLSAAELSLAST